MSTITEAVRVVLVAVLVVLEAEVEEEAKVARLCVPVIPMVHIPMKRALLIR